MSQITCEINERTGIVTIDNEKALNALNYQLIQDLGNCIKDLEDNDHIRAILLRGKGSKAFAAGADISELSHLDGKKAKELSSAGHEVFKRIEQLSKPVVAAINGYALGGGFELALACHIRLASDTAVVGLPEANLGLIPGYGGTQRLTSLVGRSNAFHYVLTGELIKSDQALSLGLVSKVFPSEEFEGKVLNYVSRLSQLSPQAMSSAIECINGHTDKNIDGYELEASHFGTLFDTDNAKEGLSAFISKRKAKFS